MAALVERHVLTSSVGGVVRGVTVVGGHCMPERTPCPSNSANRQRSVISRQCEAAKESQRRTAWEPLTMEP